MLVVVLVIIVTCLVVGGRMQRRRPSQLLGDAASRPGPVLRAPAAVGTDLLPETERRIAVEIAEGRKIMAIKMYREATGVGLKEAKDAVELWQRQGSPLPTSGVQDSPAVEGQNPYGPPPDTENGDGGSQDQWPQLPPTNRS